MAAHDEEKGTHDRPLEHTIAVPLLQDMTDCNDQAGKVKAVDDRLRKNSARSLTHMHRPWDSQMESVSFSFDDADTGDSLTILF